MFGQGSEAFQVLKLLDAKTIHTTFDWLWEIQCRAEPPWKVFRALMLNSVVYIVSCLDSGERVGSETRHRVLITAEERWRIVLDQSIGLEWLNRSLE